MMEHRCLYFPRGCVIMLTVCVCEELCSLYCIIFLLFLFFFSCALRNMHMLFVHPAVMDICIVCRHAFFDRPSMRETTTPDCCHARLYCYLFVLVVCLQRAGHRLPVTTHAHLVRHLVAPPLAPKCQSVGCQLNIAILSCSLLCQL